MIYHRIFAGARLAAGLQLKRPKCIMVPVAGASKPDLVEIVTGWLIGSLPDWTVFQVLDRIEYLGFWLGPAVFDDQFRDPLAKFKNRTCTIAKSQLQPSMAIRSYNTRAVTSRSWSCRRIPSWGLRLGPSPRWSATRDPLLLPTWLRASHIASITRTAIDDKLSWSPIWAECTTMAEERSTWRCAVIDN